MSKQKTKVFMSYAHEDASLARFIAGLLERSGVDASADDLELPLGADWQQELAKRLENADVYVLLVTPSYLQSRWGNFELGVALARARSEDVTLLPLTFGVAARDLPPALRSFQTLSLEKNDPSDVQKALQSALRKIA